MQAKQNTLTSILKLGFCALLALSAIQTQAADKVDPSGTWTWTQAGRNGGPDRTNTLTLKLDGDKLTGSLSAPGRGGAAMETPIADGKVDAGTVSFNLVMTRGGNSMTNMYSGKIDGDTIKGKVEGMRNGAPTSRDWTATRAAK